MDSRGAGQLTVMGKLNPGQSIGYFDCWTLEIKSVTQELDSGEVVNSLLSEDAPASKTPEGVMASITLGKSGPVGVPLEKASNTVADNYEPGPGGNINLKKVT